MIIDLDRKGENVEVEKTCDWRFRVFGFSIYKLISGQNAVTFAPASEQRGRILKENSAVLYFLFIRLSGFFEVEDCGEIIEANLVFQL